MTRSRFNVSAHIILISLGALITLLYSLIAILLIYESYTEKFHNKGGGVSLYRLLTMMALNEWGDFLSGVCGPLALVWVIISVILQGSELRDQREEMAKQASALEKQSSYIKQEIEREESDKCWRDLSDLLEVFREMIPIKGDNLRDRYFTLEFNGSNSKILVGYTPPADLNHANLSTIMLLSRAAGGIRRPVKQVEIEISSGKTLKNSKNGHSHFVKMHKILQKITEMRNTLPDHRKIMLESAKIDDWNEIIDIVLKAYKRN